MYDHTLYRGKIFLSLLFTSTPEILKSHINSSKTNGKQIIQIPKEGHYVKIQKLWKKNKITICNLCRFWMYFSASKKAKNPDESCTKKYQKHVCHYCYKFG